MRCRAPASSRSARRSSSSTPRPRLRSRSRRGASPAFSSPTTAGDGAEALQVFSAHQAAIGLVVLDMAMPVMDGVECFHRLRKISGVPVLVATGYANDEPLQALVADGAMIIEKPFPSTSLVVE